MGEVPPVSRRNGPCGPIRAPVARPSTGGPVGTGPGAVSRNRPSRGTRSTLPAPFGPSGSPGAARGRSRRIRSRRSTRPRVRPFTGASPPRARRCRRSRERPPARGRGTKRRPHHGLGRSSRTRAPSFGSAFPAAGPDARRRRPEGDRNRRGRPPGPTAPGADLAPVPGPLALAVHAGPSAGANRRAGPARGSRADAGNVEAHGSVRSVASGPGGGRADPSRLGHGRSPLAASARERVPRPEPRTTRHHPGIRADPHATAAIRGALPGAIRTPGEAPRRPGPRAEHSTVPRASTGRAQGRRPPPILDPEASPGPADPCRFPRIEERARRPVAADRLGILYDRGARRQPAQARALSVPVPLPLAARPRDPCPGHRHPRGAGPRRPSPRPVPPRRTPNPSVDARLDRTSVGSMSEVSADRSRRDDPREDPIAAAGRARPSAGRSTEHQRRPGPLVQPREAA